MTSIDAKEAASALSDIASIAYRVRQSTTYNLASQMLILWGMLVFAGNVATYLWPRQGAYIWIAVNTAGFAGSCAIGVLESRRMRLRTFDLRTVAAFVLFFAFGILWSVGLGHFTPRQLGVFWPTYFMMVYTIVGLWVGAAFVAIGLGITALTLVGYFFIGGWFDLWMAVVNGGGLLLGGLWMRRS
jgi:hypothetical protein